MDYRKLPKDVKLFVYAFIGAFFLSLLTGIIVKNPGGTVLLRAFLSALLFGGIVYGVMYVLKKYIPELKSYTGGTVEKPKEEGKELKVESHKGRLADYIITDEEQEVVNPVEESLFKKDDEKKESTIKEVSGDKEMELPAIEEESKAEEEKESDVSGGELPSLDQLFEDEEESAPDIEVDRKGAKSDTKVSGDYIALRGVKIPYDPEAIAKAIKKVMKEDERR